MRIKEKIDNHVAVLSLSGKMMGGPETTALHDHIRSLMSDGISKVVIDLGGVKWINSSGLGVLMAAMTTLKNADGQMKLAKLGSRPINRPQQLLALRRIVGFRGLASQAADLRG